MKINKVETFGGGATLFIKKVLQYIKKIYRKS